MKFQVFDIVQWSTRLTTENKGVITGIHKHIITVKTQDNTYAFTKRGDGSYRLRNTYHGVLKKVEKVNA